MLQHDASGPDIDPLGLGQQEPDQHFGRRACKLRRVMMLRNPEAGEAVRLRLCASVTVLRSAATALSS